MKNIETLGERSAAGLSETAGVLVLQFGSKSPAGHAEIRVGDVITAIENDSGRKDIKTMDQLQAFPESEDAIVTIVRNQKTLNITMVK